MSRLIAPALIKVLCFLMRVGAFAAGLMLLKLSYAGWELFRDVTQDLGRDPGGDRIYQTTTPTIPDRSEYSTARHCLTNGLGMELVLVPPGEFIMGSPSNEEYRKNDERPHRVRITRPFYLGACEVTVEQFGQFCAATGYRTECERNGQGGEGWLGSQRTGYAPRHSWRDPGYPQTSKHPVVNVSWNDALRFCQWLGEKEHCTYRLPREAEWEFACRAGSTTPFVFGDARQLQAAGANLNNSHDSLVQRCPWTDGHACASPAGSFKSNPLGVSDMHGNVKEWCSDWYGEEFYRQGPRDDPRGPEIGSSKVLRGGSYLDAVPMARSANRANSPPGFARCDVGFRVARDYP